MSIVVSYQPANYSLVHDITDLFHGISHQLKKGGGQYIIHDSFHVVHDIVGLIGIGGLK
jgi:hypothetical protein